MKTLLITLSLLAAAAHAADCRQVADQLNSRLTPKLDAAELAATLTVLNRDGRLPERFMTKRDANAAGWKPGRDLWQVPGLDGKSIGGDRFGNRERALPRGDWREADLDYKGGRRGAKRLLFEPRANGRRFVTVDHYSHFEEIAACR
ncbi:ribonuclease domain-containing protein [Parachitinimonas caeni]|uniref:Ribonuclease domain-containing protein n=1 Tax=Parachitinimonas caeni TaxID=3031301 RepID=A0ABT7DU71_9NEIS|nr:ribonuclease domain-containing protein [Parachitinimonas caeni]MDK2123615.1 ribonuclease domain-containing protein [Parachitinimonas caeni]